VYYIVPRVEPLRESDVDVGEITINFWLELESCRSFRSVQELGPPGSQEMVVETSLDFGLCGLWVAAAW